MKTGFEKSERTVGQCPTTLFAFSNPVFIMLLRHSMIPRLYSDGPPYIRSGSPRNCGVRNIGEFGNLNETWFESSIEFAAHVFCHFAAS